MRVLVCDPPPPSFERLLEERRRAGADRFDEVWDGVLVMAPASRGRHGRLQAQIAVLIEPLARAADLVLNVGGFNLGEPNDYRIPDAGLLRTDDDKLYFPTAALAIEVISPGDETWNKLGFYAEHDVDEVLIIDPVARTVQWFGLGDGRYVEVERSKVIEFTGAELAERLDWPPISDDQ